MYLWTDGSYLMHHGILGQKWGVRRFQNKDGSYTREGKERRVKSFKKSGLSDEQKRRIRIGLIAGGIALTAVGGYYLYKNGYLDRMAHVGEDALGGKAEEIAYEPSEIAKRISEQTGIKLKNREYAVFEDVELLSANSERTSNDCGPLALNFALRRMGLDCYSCGNNDDHIGGLSFNELGNYFRGIVRNSEVVSSGPNAKSVITDVIKKQSQMQDGSVGLIYLKPTDSNQTGHFTSWVVDHGIIKFPDVQTKSDNFIDKIRTDACDSFRIVRLDTLEVNTKNLFGNPFDLDIEPIVKQQK